MWSILTNYYTTESDHEVIEWRVKAAWQEEEKNQRVVGWDSAATMEENMETAEKLGMELVKAKANLDAKCTADDITREATWYWEKTVRIFDARA